MYKLGCGILWCVIHSYFRRSIILAKRWCSHSEWVRMDTAPFSSLTRDAGALLGLGLAQYWRPGGWALPWVPRTLCLALSSLALHYISSFQLPTVSPVLFYSLFFLKYTLVPQVVMVLIPGFVHLLTAKPKKDWKRFEICQRRDSSSVLHKSTKKPSS